MGVFRKLGKKMELGHLREVSDPIFPLGYTDTNPNSIKEFTYSRKLYLQVVMFWIHLIFLKEI